MQMEYTARSSESRQNSGLEAWQAWTDEVMEKEQAAGYVLDRQDEPGIKRH